MSIGGPNNLLVSLAIQRTIEAGIAVVAAAGNGGPLGQPVYPAAQDSVIAVTAIDSKFRLYKKATQGDYIDFTAPGVDVWAGSEKGKAKYYSGTSFAVPFVTASVAKLNVSAPNQAYKKLKSTALDLGEKGKDQYFGWGLVQSVKPCS